MEKFGEMLEAAAETAVPSNPGDSAPRRPSKALSWEHWDAAVLNEFMVEEASVTWYCRYLFFSIVSVSFLFLSFLCYWYLIGFTYNTSGRCH